MTWSRIERSKKRKTEFSKKLLFGILIVNVVIIVFTLYIVWETKDTSSLAYLIPGIFAQTATAIGFYYNKAKKENAIKLRKLYGDEIIKEEDSL